MVFQMILFKVFKHNLGLVITVLQHKLPWENKRLEEHLRTLLNQAKQITFVWPILYP